MRRGSAPCNVRRCDLQLRGNLSQTTAGITVVVVVARQDANEVADGSKDDEAVKNLVRAPEIVEAAWQPALWELCLQQYN